MNLKDHVHKKEDNHEAVYNRNSVPYTNNIQLYAHPGARSVYHSFTPSYPYAFQPQPPPQSSPPYSYAPYSPMFPPKDQIQQCYNPTNTSYISSSHYSCHPNHDAKTQEPVQIKIMKEFEIINLLQRQYHSTTNEIQFLNDNKVKDCIKVLKEHYNRKGYIPLEEKKFLFICPNLCGTKCNTGRIITKIERNAVLCRKCTDHKRNEYKRNRRDKRKRTDPSSPILHQLLSHEELSKRLKTSIAKNSKL